MKKSDWIPIALAAGVGLSPDARVLLGNGFGAAGGGYAFFVALAVVLHSLTAWAAGQGKPAGGIRWSGPLTDALALGARTAFTVFAATGVLVSAGFAFNEIFFYWFPNFAFAFLLLAVLTALNLAPPHWAAGFQVATVFVTASLLLVLSVAGLAGASGAASPSPALPRWSAGPTALVVLLGFDLAVYATDHRPRFTVRAMWIALLLLGSLGVLWGFAGLRHVPAAKLAETSVPHLVAARHILGENGRWIMGIIVIGGTCSAVNALFMALPRLIRQSALEGRSPYFFGGTWRGLPLLALSLTIALSMAGGLAGHRFIEAGIRAAALLWLLYYVWLHLASSAATQRLPIQVRLLHLAAGGTTLLGIAALVWSAPAPWTLMIFMAAFHLPLWLFLALWRRLKERNGGRRRQPYPSLCPDTRQPES